MDIFQYINYIVLYILISFYQSISKEIQISKEIPERVVDKSTRDLYKELKKYFDTLNRRKLLENNPSESTYESIHFPSPMPLFYKTMFTLKIPIQNVVNSNLFGIKDTLEFKKFMESLRKNNTLLLKDVEVNKTRDVIARLMEDKENMSPIFMSPKLSPIVSTKKWPTVKTGFNTPLLKLSRGLGFSPR